MTLPRVYAIVDADVCAREGWAPRDLAAAYLAGGVRLFQLRAKGLASGPLLELAAAMAADVAAGGGRLILNDRADLAVLARAGGVHVGQDDLSPADCRRLVGPDALVGYSTHSTAQVRDASADPVDYVAIGPIYATATKDTGYAPLGIDVVHRAAAVAAPAGRPLVAIGGMTLDLAPHVWRAGARSLAVVSDLMAGDPEKRAAAWVAAADRFDAGDQDP